MDYAQTPTHDNCPSDTLLSYQDRYKDWLFHSTPFECYVNREHLRDRLDYCFINRIRDAVPDRINDYDCIYSRPHKPVPPEWRPAIKHTDIQSNNNMTCQAFISTSLSDIVSGSVRTTSMIDVQTCCTGCTDQNQAQIYGDIRPDKLDVHKQHPPPPLSYAGW